MVFRYLYEKQSSKFIMVVWSRSDGTGIGAEVSQVTSAGQQERSEVSGQVANARLNVFDSSELIHESLCL